MESYIHTLLRIIDDVDSIYYNITLSLLDYFLSFTEGLPEKILIHMGNAIGPSRIFRTMTYLVEKLYIREKLTKDSKFRARMFERLDIEVKDKKQQLKEKAE